MSETCRCFTIVEEINAKFPDANWNLDEACEEWQKREKELEDNGIEFEDGADAWYCCNCPTCGSTVCGWCL